MEEFCWIPNEEIEPDEVEYRREAEAILSGEIEASEEIKEKVRKWLRR